MNTDVTLAGQWKTGTPHIIKNQIIIEFLLTRFTLVLLSHDDYNFINHPYNITTITRHDS